MRTIQGSILLLGFLLFSLPASGQDVEQITVEWIYGDEGENATKLPAFAWTNSGDLLLLDEPTHSTAGPSWTS